MNILSDMLASAVVQRLGWTLLHSVWQFTLVAILLSALLVALRRSSANTRYLTACIGLVAMLTTSMATYWWLVACPATDLAVTTATDGAPPAERVDVRDEVIPDDFTEAPSFFPPELPDNAPSTAFAAEPALVGNDGTSDDAASATPATLSRRIIEGLGPWLPWVSLAWLGGVIFLSIRHLGGWVGVQRLRWAGTSEVGLDLSDHARQLMDRTKISRPVRILQSTLAELPIVVGWLRPVVLLPAGLLTGLSPKQLEAILAHELAHVRRYDYLCNLLQTAAETLLFYHPAVWWLSRRIRIEREHCCDDVAVAVCGSKVDYAEALAAVEQRRAAALAMAVGIRGRMGSALGRVRRVLGISTEDKLRWTQTIGGSVAVLLLIVALVSYMAAASEAQRGQDHQAAESSVPTSEDVDEPLPDDDNKNGVAQLVEQLGDETYQRRYTAQRELIDMGEAAVAALKEALSHKDREIAVRAEHCLAEIDRRIETQRKVHRQAASQAAQRSDPAVATRHYRALLKLPEPALCDCQAASEFFEARRDFESIALAMEATAKEMKRVIHTPVEQFIRPAPENPGRREGGPTVLVQTGLDGVWVNGKGTAESWVDWLKRKQDRMKPDRLDLLVELGRLYRDRLGQPKKAVAALANAMCDVEFFTEPIDKVIAREWPIRSKEHKEVHGPVGGSYLNTLRELSEMQQQAGDLDGAIETKTRQLLAHFILCWGHRQKVSNRPAFELGTLLRKLPADAPLPPLFWINVLGPENCVVTLDLDERSPLEMHDLNVLARPGYVFDSLEVTADMEGIGGRGEVSCYTVFEKHTTLGRLKWHEDKRRGREEISQKFKIPPEANLIRFETQPWELEGLLVHRVTVKATFRPGAGEPTEKEATADPGTKHSEILLEGRWPDGKTVDGAGRPFGISGSVYVFDPADPKLNKFVRTPASCPGLEVTGLELISRKGYPRVDVAFRFRGGKTVGAGLFELTLLDKDDKVLDRQRALELRNRELPVEVSRVGELGGTDPPNRSGKAELRFPKVALTDVSSYRLRVVEPEIPLLVELLDERDVYVRECAARALGQWGAAAEASLPKLQELSQDEQERVRSAAKEAVRRIRKAAEDTHTAWGPAIEGVQVRLRADGKTWKTGTIPSFKADVRNQGTRDLYIAQTQALCELEVDGNWYQWAGPGGEDVKYSPFSPGRQYDGIPVTLVSSWHSKKANRPLEVTIGKHIVRAAFIPDPMENDGKPVRAVSNPVEIEIEPAGNDATASSTGAEEPVAKGMEFLAKIHEFRELNLKMTQPRLREIIHSHSVAATCVDLDDSRVYHLYTTEGENVLVTFRDGECAGIQRMRPDPDTAAKLYASHNENLKKCTALYFKTCEFLCQQQGDRMEAAQRFAKAAQLAPASETGVRAHELADLLEKMVKETRPKGEKLPAGVFDRSGDISLTGELENLFFDVRDLSYMPAMVPGKCRVLGEAVISLDKGQGNPALRIRDLTKDPARRELIIPRLLRMLDDRRPTRSWAGAMNGGHVLRYCDVALEILADVAGMKKPNNETTHFDPRTTRDAYLGTADAKRHKEIIARVNAWWTQQQAKAVAAGETKVARPVDADARQRFLAIERLARLPMAEQAKQLPRLYKDLAPRYMNPFVEGLLSSYRDNILDPKKYGAPGDDHTTRWAQQLADVASEMTPEEVADKLEIGLWLNVAARARAIQVFKKHTDAMTPLIEADLSANRKQPVERAAATILAVDLRTFTDRLLAMYIEDADVPEGVYRTLLFLRDRAIMRPLLEEVKEDPKFLVRCAGLFQGPLYRKPAEPLLLGLLNSPDAEIRYGAVRAVYECSDPKLAQPAVELAREKEARLRSAAAQLASNLPGASFAAVRDDLLPLLSDKEEAVQFDALRCFAQQKDLAAGPVILKLLKRHQLDEQFKVTVMQAMSKLAGSNFNYYMHEWGPDRPANQRAIEKFEAWLQEPRKAGGAHTSSDHVAWGETVNGLQAGLATAFDHVRPFQLGHNVPLKFLLRNTSDKPIAVAHDRVPVFINWDNYRRPPGPQLFGADGKQVFPASGVGGRGLPGSLTRTIAPGEVVTMTTSRLPLRPENWKGTTVNLLTYGVKPGKHRVSLSHQFDDQGGKHWGGTLTTGMLDLYVHSNEKPISIPGNPWGKEQNGVRCRLHTDKARLRSDEPPILTVDLQNHHTQRTLEQIWHGLEFKLEVDGKWTGKFSPTEVSGPVAHLTPGQEWINVPLALQDSHYYMAATSSAPGGPPRFSQLFGPGRHTIRVDIDGVVSNPVEIEILPDGPKGSTESQAFSEDDPRRGARVELVLDKKAKTSCFTTA